MPSTTPLSRRSVEPRGLALLAVALGPALEGLLGGGLDRWLFAVVAVAGGVGQGLAAAGAVVRARRDGGRLAWAAAAVELLGLGALLVVLAGWAGVFFAGQALGPGAAPLAQRLAVGLLVAGALLAALARQAPRRRLASGALLAVAWALSWPAAQAVIFGWSATMSTAWPHITAALGLAVLAGEAADAA